MIIADGPHDELLSVDRSAVLSYFMKHGVVLFREFTVGVESFQFFVNSYSKAQLSYPGGDRVPVSLDGKVQTVAGSTGSIRLHSELSHTPFRPDICWFYCVVAPAHGSETILCDGSLVASELPAWIVEQFEQNLLRYRWTTSIVFLQQLVGTRDAAALRSFVETGPHADFYDIRGDEVRQDFVAPALQKPKFSDELAFANNIIHNFRIGNPLLYPTFADGSLIPERLIVTIRDLTEHLTFGVQWRDGDLLMFDNTRFMHGRRTITDPSRTIWTQFSDAVFD
jgi:alpha-ketoglutarate-dependent taurine dioxygenase